MLTKLEQFKLNNYRKWYPKIQSAEQALQKALEFEEASKTWKGSDNAAQLMQDSNQLLNMAELLEKA